MANSSRRIEPRPGRQLFRYILWAAKRRARMVDDLANLQDGDGAEDWFWRKWGGDHPRTNWNRPLHEYRDELRQIWAVPLSDSHEWGSLADVRLRSWLNEAHIPDPRTWRDKGEAQPTRGTWRLWLGCVYPDYRSLPLSLAVAVSELAPKMTVCSNPECPQKYFLKGRKTQRFCDRPACIVYGQGQHKLDWWRRVGNDRRAKRKKAASEKNRREGKNR